MKQALDISREQLKQLSKDELIEIILQLLPRIQKLEDQIAKNSNNSGKPPSSDGLNRKPKSLRQKTERQSGGQKGHKGHTLKMSETPDDIVPHTVDECHHCGEDLQRIEAIDVEKRQVFDIPRVYEQVVKQQVEARANDWIKRLHELSQPILHFPHSNEHLELSSSSDQFV